MQANLYSYTQAVFSQHSDCNPSVLWETDFEAPHIADMGELGGDKGFQSMWSANKSGRRSWGDRGVCGFHLTAVIDPKPPEESTHTMTSG